MAGKDSEEFSKKSFIKISNIKLSQRQSALLSRNKLSDKLGRRDIQFYDLYKLDKPEDNVKTLDKASLPFDGVLKGTWVDPIT